MTEPNPQEYYHGWNLIRSEPDIFTTMIRNYGINGVVAEDVFTLDDLPTLSQDDTYGILLAYRYAEDPLPANATAEDPQDENIVFIPQLITNSCATVGLLNVLCNAPIEKGDILNHFINFTDGFDNISRGLALGNDPVYRNIHNSYSFDESEGDVGSDEEEEGPQSHGAGAGAKTGTKTGDVAKGQVPAKPESSDSDSVASGLGNNYHFVAYIFNNHCIWELDGLKPHPIKLQRVNSRVSWLNVLKPILANKIQASALTANIISIVKDPILYKEEEMGMLLIQSAKLAKDIAKSEAKGQSSTSTKSLKLYNKKAELDDRIALLQTQVVAERADADERLSNVDRDLVEYFPFFAAAAQMALNTGMNLEAFRRPTGTSQKSAGQGTLSVEKKTEAPLKKDKGKGRAVEFNPALFTKPITPSSSEGDKGEGKVEEIDPEFFFEQFTTHPPKDDKGKGKGKGKGRATLLDPKTSTAKDSKGKGKAVELGFKPLTVTFHSTVPQVPEAQKQETGSSATKEVQESVGQPEASTSGASQGNVEGSASTSSAIPKDDQPEILPAKKDKGKGRAVEFQPKPLIPPPSRLPPKKAYKPRGRADELEPKPVIPQPSRLPPKKAYRGSGRIIQAGPRPFLVPSLPTASQVPEDKKQETEPSTTEEVQESAGQSEATTSGAVQENVEGPASTSSATPQEAGPATDEPRQGVQPGKRKLDDISDSDDQPELPPAKKDKGKGRAVELEPKPVIPQPSRLPPKKAYRGSGRIIQVGSRSLVVPSFPTASQVPETGSSTTEQAQESAGQSVATTSGVSQGNVEDPASTSSATPQEASSTTEETGQEVQPGKRKLDDISDSDDQPELPPAKKPFVPSPPTEEKKTEEAGSPATEKVQEVVDEEGESEGSEEYPPFSIEVTGQEVQPGKRKFDDMSGSDDEPESPPAKKK